MNIHSYPLISVIIPIYNGEKYILETCTSLLQQTFTDFEVICVDDSSTDSSLEILKQISAKDSRFKIYSKQNEGTASKGVNFGLKHAKGRYIMYSSQDDLFSEDLLEQQYRVISNEDLDAVIPKMCFYYSSEECKNFKMSFSPGEKIDGNTALILSLNWKIHGFVLWKASLVLKNGFYDLTINGDEFTTRELYSLCSNIGFSNGTFYYRKGNSNSITRKWNIRIFESFQTFDAILELISAKYLNRYRGIVIQQILFDLVRVNTIALKAERSMSEETRMTARVQIKMLYNKYQREFTKAEYETFKQRLIGRFIAFNFLNFSFFCKMYLLLRNDRI